MAFPAHGVKEFRSRALNIDGITAAKLAFCLLIGSCIACVTIAFVVLPRESFVSWVEVWQPRFFVVLVVFSCVTVGLLALL